MKTYGGILERSSSLIFKSNSQLAFLLSGLIFFSDAKGSHRPKWIIWQMKYFNIGTFHKAWKWNRYLFSEEFFMLFHFNLYLHLQCLEPNVLYQNECGPSHYFGKQSKWCCRLEFFWGGHFPHNQSNIYSPLFVLFDILELLSV